MSSTSRSSTTTSVPAKASACCGASAVAPSESVTSETKAASAEGATPPGSAATPCCAKPTPNAANGSCCEGPSPDCGCQKPQPNESLERLPVAVIGAGPVGLVAAAHLIARGEVPLVLEAGPAVGASIREWAHVRLFSPWKYVVDPTARGMLEASGWSMPNEERLPTGGEIVSHFLEPLAALPTIAPHVRVDTRVVQVTRRGFDKVKSAGRDDAPFELLLAHADGRSERVLARAVIDASGTWRSPNPMGAGGVVADGEEQQATRIAYRMPDVLGAERPRYAGKRTLVVGSGHSAFNVLLDLATLAESAPNTSITWALRRTDPGLLFGGGAKDALEARGALGTRVQQLVEREILSVQYGVRITRVVTDVGTMQVEDDAGTSHGPFDEIVVATGFRPDLAVTRELRLKLDPWLEAPEALAPLIDPNLHSCGTVYPHGAAELAHPERDFYVVGMKSYGRAPTFLLLTGYEQVRSVVCALVGDLEGARKVELVLPETGVCQSDLSGVGGGCCSTDDTSGASCGTASEPEVVSLGRRAKSSGTRLPVTV